MCRDLLDRWLNARFKDGAVRVPYVQGFERKMIKIRGRVLSKEEVLRQNLLPDWPESIAYQKERAKKQLRKAHELVQQAALRHAEKGKHALAALRVACCCFCDLYNRARSQPSSFRHARTCTRVFQHPHLSPCAGTFPRLVLQ